MEAVELQKQKQAEAQRQSESRSEKRGVELAPIKRQYPYKMFYRQ